MIRLSKILVPTDFSEFSQPALNYGCALAARFDSELHLLHVLEDPMLIAPAAAEAGPELIRSIDEWHSIAGARLEELPGDGWENGRPIVRETRRGPAFVEIVGYAKEHDIDLIVVGTHGRTGLQHVFMGSVAERVVRKAPCPVLTVRPEGHQFVMP